ncbi:hypothetical protein JCM11491_002787 [Sporobolomyces phaffii]
MASLNWVVLDHNTLAPVPLPREKTLMTLAAVSISLVPAPARSATRPPAPTGEYKADRGTVYLSNQRVVYVAPPTLPPGDSPAPSPSPSPSGATLETLSVPYTHFQDGRFHQPFFGANYYEATCLNAPDGGLSVPHVVRLYFKEGGGFDFYSTVLEMKERLAAQQPRGRAASANGTVAEDLPLYSATAPTASRASSSNSTPTRTSAMDRAPTLPPQSRSAAFDPPPVPPIGNDAPPSYVG